MERTRPPRTVGRAVACSRSRPSSATSPTTTRTCSCRSCASRTCSARTARRAFGRLLRRAVVPDVAGFDPRLQFVHEDDVADALALRDAARRTRRLQRRRRRACSRGARSRPSTARAAFRSRRSSPGSSAEPLRVAADRRPPARAARAAALRPRRRHVALAARGIPVPPHHARDRHGLRRGPPPRDAPSDPSDEYTYERDVETFFRHSPAVVRDAGPEAARCRFGSSDATASRSSPSTIPTAATR